MSDAREYLKIQGVEEKIANAVKQVITDRPSDAVKRIGELLMNGQAPCYMIIRTTPTDMQKFGAYGAKAGELLTTFGAQILSFNACSSIEGPLTGSMGGAVMGIIRFPDKATGENWYNSPKYQAIIPDRLASTADETTFTFTTLLAEPDGPPGSKAYMTIRTNPLSQGMTKWGEYASKVGEIVKSKGGKVLAFGPASPLEGQLGMPILGILEWPDEATCKSWYDSPEYQEILPLRKAGTYGETTFTVVTGFAG